jgi:zinc finger protein CreA/MIG
MYDTGAMQQMNTIPPLSSISQMPPISHQQGHVSQLSPISHVHQPVNHMMPPPPKNIQSAPVSQITSPNVSPPHSYSSYTTNPGAYLTRNISGDISSLAHGAHSRNMDINLLATAASQVERENNQLPNPQLSLPRHSSYSSPYHAHPYGSNRMPSLSSYHYSSNPTSQPMSRSHSHDEEDHYHHRAAKKSRPGSPLSTAPPSPSFSQESISPTPDHTPLATPSHSPRLRPQYYHHGVQLPTLHHLSLHHHHPPPALAPVEPAADGHQPYVPVQHSGLRISEIMQAGDGAQRKLPIPIMQGKDSSFAVRDLIHPDGGRSSGHSSARASDAGNDLHERY